MGSLFNDHEIALASKEEWLTPPELLQTLGEFDLDPCAPIVRPWPMAKEHFTLRDDGLRKEWFGRVWVNPPYGNRTGIWMERLARHGNGIALIFARTETAVWQDIIFPLASAVNFLRGRINFHNVNGTRAKQCAGAPSALIAFEGGANVEAISRVVGKTVVMR